MIRGLTKNHDWIFGQGLQSYKFRSDEIAQNIKSRVLSWKGDCFFALNEGVNWNQYFNSGNKLLLDQDIKRVIIQTKGVSQLLEFNSEIRDRVYLASYTYQDIFSKSFQSEINTELI